MLEFINMLIFKQTADANLCKLIGKLETINFFMQIKQVPMQEG